MSGYSIAELRYSYLNPVSEPWISPSRVQIGGPDFKLTGR